ncbi:hypothetical protein ABPG72_008025 [Tetrahymena utriculariae]
MTKQSIRVIRGNDTDLINIIDIQAKIQFLQIKSNLSVFAFQDSSEIKQFSEINQIIKVLKEKKINTENQEQSQFQDKKYNSLKTITQQGLLCKQYYKAQEECLIERVYPVSKPLSLLILEITLQIVSGGLVFILFSWNNQWKFKIFYKLVNINQARYFVVYGPDKDVQIKKIMDIEKKCVFQF